MLETQRLRSGKDLPKGTIRIISVEQRHERSGRVVILLDGESMGETKTDLRKRQFTYLIQGFTKDDIKPGSWILSPREDLGYVLEVFKLSPKRSKKKSVKRLTLRVRFDEVGTIRLNEIWDVLTTQPITRRMRERWQKRMTESAAQYFRQVLPGVLDSVLFESKDTITGEQINQIRKLQEQILCQAIKIAQSQETVQMSSTQLVRATKEILAIFKKTSGKMRKV